MMRIDMRRAVAVGVLAGAMGAGCGDGTGVEPLVPVAITMVPAELALDALGATHEMDVTVFDAFGSEVDTTVSYVSSDEAVATVDGSGEVTAVAVGVAQITASLGELTRVSQVAVVQLPAALDKVAGDGQSGTVGGSLDTPLRVSVNDRLGNPIAAAPVSFEVTAGGGSVSAGTATTGADGLAETSFVLGTGTGAAHRVVADVPGGSATPAVFTATATAAAPDRVQAEAGRDQRQPKGSTLPIPLAVSVTDRFGNGVAGETVDFSVTRGTGTVSPEQATTDEDGIARTDWTLGTDRTNQRVEARVSAVGNSAIRFNAAGTNLAITAIAPDTLKDGQPGQLTGVDFDPNDANLVVTVDGVPAPVTGVTATTIDFTVPEGICRPARPVEVRVTTTDGGTTPGTSHPTAPGAFVSLAVGELTLVRDPEDFCFQFDNAAADEVYLLGVQSVTDQGQLLTRAAPRGAVVGQATARPSRWRPPAAAPATRPVAGSRQAARIERWQRHREAEVARRVAERRMFADPSRVRAPGIQPVAAPAIDSTVVEGTTVSFKLPDISAGGNICTNSQTLTLEVKVVGRHGIWLADQANPADGFTTADYIQMSELFDDVIFQAGADYFGEPTDVDRNGRVIIMVTKEINETAPNVLGFVSPADVLGTASGCASTNTAEVYYSRAPDPTGGAGGGVYTREMALEDVPTLIAHEFTHIIQSGRRLVVKEAPFPAIFVAEGQATLAEEVTGHAAEGRTTGQNLGDDVAFNRNEADRSDWYAVGFTDVGRYFGANGTTSDTPSIPGAPHECGWLDNDPNDGGALEPCQGRSLWYGVTWMFLRWIGDTYGPTFPGGEKAIQRAIIDKSDLIGLPNIEDVVGVPIDSLLGTWAAMLYADDRIPGLTGPLSLPSWNLLDIYEGGGLIQSASLSPRSLTFSDFVRSVDVRAGSAAYFLISGADRPATAVRVTDPNDETLAEHMRTFLVRIQ